MIRLWHDPTLGRDGVDLLAGRCHRHRYAPHFHAEVVVAAFSGGAQRHTVGRHRGVATAGSVLVIPPGETHTGAAVAEAAGWAYRAFYPDVDTLERVAAETFRGRAAHGVAFGTQPLRTDPPLAARLLAAHAAVERNGDDVLAREAAFAAAMRAVLARGGRGRSVRPARVERAAIAAAKACAHDRFREPGLSVGDLAAAAGLSPYHFMRVFRATTGMTAHAFVRQLRLDAARPLLARGRPAAEVAYAAGFADQSHLIRRFRAAFGVTPGEYARATRRAAVP